MSAKCWRQVSAVDRADDRDEVAKRMARTLDDDHRVVEVIRNGSPNPRIEARVDHSDVPMNTPVARFTNQDAAQAIADQFAESAFRVVYVYGRGEYLIEEVHEA